VNIECQNEMHSRAKMFKLLGEGELDTYVREYEMIWELAIQTQRLAYFDVWLSARVWIGRRKTPEIFEKVVCEHNILLICGIENRGDVGIRESNVLEVLANQSAREFDTTDSTALLTENSIAEPFKDVLVVLVCGDVVHPNKEVKQVKMDQLIIDRGWWSKRSDICQLCQSLSSTRFSIRCQRDDTKFSQVLFAIGGVDNNFE
jgi:hypothetical protein